MPDKKRTERTEKHTRALDNEIKKALECCQDEMGCNYCPFYNDEKGTCKGAKGIFEKATLDLINRLQAENKRLSTLAELGNTRANDYRVMRDRALKAEAENERLSHNLEAMAVTMSNSARAERHEAYKEFVERLCEDRVVNDPVVIAAICLLKELVGDT